MKNIDKATVEGFGDEWTRFDQSSLSNDESQLIFDKYFDIFPWDLISETSVGFDLGCGSGRWAKLVAPKVGKLLCIEPSSAIKVARKNLANCTNCEFIEASVETMPIQDNSMDFGYSLGVLHHIPNTFLGLKQCVDKLKNGAPFLVYLYYRFDNKPLWFKLIWRLSDIFRIGISRMPHKARYITSQIIAATIYFPLARTCLFFEKIGFNISNFPLNSYRNLSFYTMRTDALDRFGTRLEQRFTKNEIEVMMINSGLINISFSNSGVFWCAVGYKSNKDVK
jgi:SAM-dependent methyltransferase